jgi:ubiquinone/menaquinone biosynthesis C-methylase UbiE
MEFDDAFVSRYESWFRSPQGRFAYQVQRHLLERLVAVWPRRGQKLLEVGCGPGIFLEALWEAGFDVSGLDPSPAMLKAARSRLGTKAELHLGRAEHLPFDDKEFDYVTLFTVLEFCDSPEEALREAVRVARKGLLVGFLNRWSLYYLSHGKVWPWTKRLNTLRQAHWFSVPEVSRLVGQAAGRRPCKWSSVLPGPAFSWRGGWPWSCFNARIYPGCLGAICAVRCDLLGQRATTPLMAFKTEPKPGF